MPKYSTDMEAEALVATYRNVHPEADNTHIYQLISTDYWMRADVLSQAERKAAQAGAPVYVYRFECRTPVRDGKLKSPHGLEIPFVFDNVDKGQSITGMGADRQPVADKMSAAWVAFARTGRPDAEGLPRWPAYTKDERAVMVFDNETAVVKDPHPERREVMAELKARQAEE